VEIRALYQPVGIEVVAEGPALQVPIATGATAVAGTLTSPGTIAWPETIAAAGTFTSPLLLTQGLTHWAVGGTLSTAGSVELQPYLDLAGLTPNGAPLSGAITAGAPFVLDVNVGVVMRSAKVEIVNTDSAAGTLTNPLVVAQSR
jgi:hypothetical protein